MTIKERLSALVDELVEQEGIKEIHDLLLEGINQLEDAEEVYRVLQDAVDSYESARDANPQSEAVVHLSPTPVKSFDCGSSFFATVAFAQLILEQALASVGARSACLYGPDPNWNGEFRLLVHSGVRYPEALHGLLPMIAREAVLEGPEVLQVSAEEVEDPCERVHPEIGHLKEKVSPLFGSFVSREGIASFVRFLRRSEAGEVEAVLFVNFEHRSISQAKVDRASEFFGRLLEMLPAILAELKLERVLPDFSALGRVSKRLADVKPGGDQLFEKCLGEVLEILLRAFKLSPRRTFATIHANDSRSKVLRLAACTKDANLDRIPQALETGQGVVSWVALRQRSVLIEDLASSAFTKEKIYFKMKNSSKSELAVPLLVGDELVGVLNMESQERAAFSPDMLRSLSLAANELALVCSRYRETCQHALTRKLLDALDKDFGVVLTLLAQSAFEWLTPENVEIWSFDGRKNEFVAFGSSSSKDESLQPPRPGGWTRYIVKTLRPVFIKNIKSETCFESFQLQRKEIWESIQYPRRTKESLRQPIGPFDTKPRSVNARAWKNGFRCQLGLPVLDGADRCVGVAWLQYRESNLAEVDNRNLPIPNRVILAQDIANEAGLMIEKSFLKSAAR